MFNLNWCRNLCHKGTDDGTLTGKDTTLSSEDLVPLSAHFHRALHIKKTIDPKKVALNCSERQLTFEELDGFSTSIAQALKLKLGSDFVNSNPEKELIIAICLPATEKMITVIFAVLKTGAAYLPLEPNCPENILLSIVERFKPVLLIADENGPVFTKYDMETFTEVCPILSLDDLWISMNVSSISLRQTNKNVLEETKIQWKGDPNIKILPVDKPVVVLQTTDISTDPRGVRIANKSLINQLLWTWRELSFNKHPAWCLTAPPSTISSVIQIFAPLLKGVTLHVLGRRDTKQMDTFVQRIGEKKITKLFLIPVVLKDFLNECFSLKPEVVSKQLSSLSMIVCQGDVLPKSLAYLFFTVFPSHKTLTTIYGFPELSGDVIFETFTNESDVDIKTFQRMVTYGKVTDNTTIRIMGPGSEPIKEWLQGEICVSGLSVSLGYVDMKTHQIEHAFIENPLKESEKHSLIYRTGLYGRMVRCGDERLRLYIEGRADDIVRHQGFEFAMEDVKHIISALPMVRFMEAVLFHPGRMDQALVGFVVAQPSPSASELTSNEIVGELDFQLRTKLPEFMIPEIKITNNLPFVVNTGRIDQSGLLLSYQLDREPSPDVWNGMKLQTTALEEAARVLFLGMFKFCSSVVKTCISNTDLSLFDLGVSSLNVVGLSSYLTSEGYDIHLREMLSDKSAHDFITLLADRKAGNRGKGRRKSSNLAAITAEVKETFSLKILDTARSKEAFKLIATAYTQKGELESYNMVRPQEYIDFLTYYFNAYKEQSGCFYVTQKPYNDVVGVCVGHDYFTDFNIKMNASLTFIIDLHQEIKGVNLARLPHKRNKILELFLMATHERMTPAENVQLVLLMFGELTTFADKENYTHIYVNTTNQLIRDLCTGVLGYTVIDDFPIREFTQKDGYRPYRLAPSVVSMASICCRLASHDSRGDGHHHHHKNSAADPQPPSLSAEPPTPSPTSNG